MAEFKIEIAGQVFAVHSLFDSTRDYCRAYLSDKKEQYRIAVARDHLQFEQDFLRAEAIEEGIRIRTFTDPFLERAAIQRQVADLLIRHGTVLLHGSAVAVDGQGYLFTAKCGTGKSTHTRLWRQAFGQRAVMINDDKPFIRLSGSGAVICGAPWSGKHGLDTNITVPLKGICILERGVENRIRSIVPADAREMLYKQCSPPLDEALLPTHRELVERLLACTPLWRMECNKEIGAAITAHRAMSI